MGQKRCFQEKFEFWLICADISGGKISFPNPRNICSGWERHKTRSRLMAQLYGISASITATNSKNPDPIHPNSWKQSCKRLWIICASFNISSRGSFRQHENRRSERFCPLSAGKETSSQVHRTRTADRIREPPTQHSQAFIRARRTVSLNFWPRFMRTAAIADLPRHPGPSGSTNSPS